MGAKVFVQCALGQIKFKVFGEGNKALQKKNCLELSYLYENSRNGQIQKLRLLLDPQGYVHDKESKVLCQVTPVVGHLGPQQREHGQQQVVRQVCGHWRLKNRMI